MFKMYQLVLSVIIVTILSIITVLAPNSFAYEVEDTLSGTGSIIGFNSKDMEGFGLTYDRLQINPSKSKKTNIFFQWQVSFQDGKNLKIRDINKSGEKVDISYGEWDDRTKDVLYKNVKLPFIIEPKKDGFKHKDSQYYLVRIAFRNKVDSSYGIGASPTNENATNQKKEDNTNSNLVDGYFWCGSGSVISKNSGKMKGVGLTEDIVSVRAKYKGKPTAFFQWQVDTENGKNLIIRSSNSNLKKATITYGLWKDRKNDIVIKDVILPYIIEPKNTGFYVIRVDFNEMPKEDTYIGAIETNESKETKKTSSISKVELPYDRYDTYEICNFKVTASKEITTLKMINSYTGVLIEEFSKKYNYVKSISSSNNIWHVSKALTIHGNRKINFMGIDESGKTSNKNHISLVVDYVPHIEKLEVDKSSKPKGVEFNFEFYTDKKAEGFELYVDKKKVYTYYFGKKVQNKINGSFISVIKEGENNRFRQVKLKRAFYTYGKRTLEFKAIGKGKTSKNLLNTPIYVGIKDGRPYRLKTFLKMAKAEIGYSEEYRGNNKNKFAKVIGVKNYQYWCHTFLSAIAKNSGCKRIIPICSGTENGYEDFISWKQWRRKNPKPGDIVYFFTQEGTQTFSNGRTRNVNHVGIVESLNSDGSITTIEGNIGNKVSNVTRWSKGRGYRIVGYGRPLY